ncbi:MAG: hypothetical protein LUH02_00310 [Erysipelotrichaceae bacterium]|nr:hypothetical protein [Erysipelotrichaceae bacterium]
MDYLNENICNKAVFYKEQLPSFIGVAIYNFGSNDDYDILAYIDVDGVGEKGIILTSTHFYFSFAFKDSFSYDDIETLTYEKHHNNDKVTAIIKTHQHTYKFSNHYINQLNLLKFLSEVSDKPIDILMNDYEKIEYYLDIVFDDIDHDNFEDVTLTYQQALTFKELCDNLNLIRTMDDQNYAYELQTMLPKALSFFDELDIGSDEIDALVDLYDKLHKQEEDQISAYDDMMDKIKQGDPKTMDQLRSAMKMLGISEDELRNMSHDELIDYLYQLADQYHVPKGMLDKMIKKYDNR